MHGCVCVHVCVCPDALERLEKNTSTAGSIIACEQRGEAERALFLESRNLHFLSRPYLNKPHDLGARPVILCQDHVELSKQNTCPDVSLPDLGLGQGFGICISQASAGDSAAQSGGRSLGFETSSFREVRIMKWVRPRCHDHTDWGLDSSSVLVRRSVG